MKKHRRPTPAPPKPAKIALVQIEKPIYGGAFLARVDGKATFVPMTLPGEQARVRILEDKRSFSTAEPEGIVTAAPNRVEPRCPHFGVCGGCSYQHTDYDTQLAFKREILRETLQRAGVQPSEQIDTLAGEPWGYRNRIRLAFDRAGNVGYRGRRSHDIFAIRECPVTAPLLVKAALAASKLLRASKPALAAKELSLFCDPCESALLCTVSGSESSIHGFEKFAAEWKERIPELAGVEYVEEASSGESSRQLACWGEESIVYPAAEFNYRVGHGAFFQVNRWLIDRLVERVVGEHRGDLAWDLFAGVGLFSSRLTRSFEKVIAVESAPAAIEALRHNLQGTSTQAVADDTLSFLKSQSSIERPDLIVVDPPRAGLGAEVTGLLSGIAAPSIVYVSCDPSTLARDLKALVGFGYALASVTLVDLFPQTFHLETVVTLRKS